MKHLFIINPVAGNTNQTEAIAAKVALALSERGDDYEIHITKAPREAEDVVRREADLCNELRIYACGGDGTLGECVSGAVGLPNVAVTHFPCGTGNDFIRTFGDESQLFFQLERLIDGFVRPIDVIRCNDRYSVNICSVGVDARIGTGVHKYSSLPIVGGATGYVLSTISEFIKGISRKMKISCAGREFDEEICLACACNGRYYGGGFNPVPNTMPDDGIIDFLVVPKVSRLTFLRLIGDYASGKARRHPDSIVHLRSNKMTISAAEEFVFQHDGELMMANHVDISLWHNGVNFIFPHGMRFFERESTQLEENESNLKISV